MGPLALGAQRQKVHQRARIHRHVHRGIDGEREHDSGDLACHTGLQHPLIGGERFRRHGPHLVADQLGLLGASRQEVVGSRLADLHKVALGAWNVEDRVELAVATAFLVVGSDAVTHEFPKDEDRRLHVKSHRVVLERRTVAVAH